MGTGVRGPEGSGESELASEALSRSGESELASEALMIVISMFFLCFLTALIWVPLIMVPNTSVFIKLDILAT